MAFSTQENFSGVLDGTTVNEINNKIDYKKTKLQDRKEAIEEILDGTDFYPEYFSGFFKANLNAGDGTSERVNVCKSLERMANYLLNSDEIKAEEDEEVTKYVFHTDEKYFKKKVDREQSIESLMDMGQGNQESEAVIHFLKREGKNYKDDKIQVVTKKDLEQDTWLGQILRDYTLLLDHTTSELQKGKASKYNRYYLTKVKGSVLNDMTYSKDVLNGVWGYDLKSFSETTNPNLDVFDFTNHLHLKGCVIETDKGNRIVAKGLLYFKPSEGTYNDFDHILWDLQDTIDKAGLTDFEKDVLEDMRNGLMKTESAALRKVHHVKVVRAMDIIASKVSKVGNKYDGVSGEAV